MTPAVGLEVEQVAAVPVDDALREDRQVPVRVDVVAPGDLPHSRRDLVYRLTGVRRRVLEKFDLRIDCRLAQGFHNIIVAHSRSLPGSAIA